jgi:hypothetical protein
MSLQAIGPNPTRVGGVVLIVVAAILNSFGSMQIVYAAGQEPDKQAPKPADDKPDGGKRRAPTVLVPTESAAAVAFTQVRSFIFKGPKSEMVLVLTGDKPQPGMDRDATWINIKDLNTVKNAPLAQTVLPLRQTIIVASFPYRKQLQEFQNKLGLDKLADVLADVTGETTDDDDKVRLPAFGFVGVDFEWRSVDATGKPLGNWNKVRTDRFKWAIFQNGKQFETEPQDLQLMQFPGLVMPRLETRWPGQYPPVENQLAALAKTRDALKADPKAVPDHCLIRVIDLDAEPGGIYKYRLRVRMANPNYKVANVASPELAQSKEPLVSDWYELPQPVVVPLGYRVYAVDQQALEGKSYIGQNSNIIVDSDRQAVFQVHKWLSDVRPDPKQRDGFEIGEWSVAERVPVYRGEHIGRIQRVEVAYYRPTREAFVMAEDPADKIGKLKGLPVDFNPPEGDMILVDFEGGRLAYKRAPGPKEGKPEAAAITESAGVEALILSPDGRLLARNSWDDAADKERVESLKDWREWIESVKSGKAHRNPKYPVEKAKNPFEEP